MKQNSNPYSGPARWLTTGQVKGAYNLSKKRLKTLRENEAITYKLEGNRYLYSAESLDAYFAESAVERQPLVYVEEHIQTPDKEETSFKGGSKMAQWIKEKSKNGRSNGRARLHCGDFTILEKQSNGKANYYLDYRDDNNVRRTQSIKKMAGRAIRDREDALAIALEERNKMSKRQVVLVNPNVRFSEFVPVYLEEKKGNDLRSYKLIESIVKNRLEPWFGDMRLRDISIQTVKRYRDYRRKMVDDVTVKNELVYLKDLYNIAADNGHELGPNPVSFKKLKFQITQRERYMTVEEEAVIWPLLSKYPLLEDMATFALNTAMRPGNICSLRWEDIRWEEQVAIISADLHKQKSQGKYLLNDKVLEILRRRQSENGKSAYVFYRYEGENPRPIPLRWVQKQWQMVMEEAGIEDLHFYDLKHTCLSRLAVMGANVFTLKAVSNHASTSSLEKYVKKAAFSEAALGFLNQMNGVCEPSVKNGVQK